jgi:cell wall-associated NlpC family hydrolase
MPSSYDGASMRAPRPTLSTGFRSTLSSRAQSATLRIATIVPTAALVVSGLLGANPDAHAASSAPQATSAPQTTSSHTHSHHRTAAQRVRSRADRVLRVTHNQAGDPYQYGAAGPSRFDCSGLVMYVFKHALGRSLPHNAQAQYARSRHITRSHLKRGDLVFQVDGGGYAYHVGIYAGHGYMWDAPHTGARVHKHKMYSASWRFGRIIHARS